MNDLQEIKIAFARNGFPEVKVYPPRTMRVGCDDYLIKDLSDADRRLVKGEMKRPMVGCSFVSDADHSAKVMRALLERYDGTGGEGFA